MAAAKKFPVSIVLRAIDNATATFRRVDRQLHGLTKPVRTLTNRFRTLGRAANLGRMARGFGRMRSQLGGIARGLGAVGLGAGAAVAGFTSMINSADDLAKTADRIGITIDSLAQLRFAAERSGVEQSILNSSMGAFSKRLGEAKAGGGALVGFLKKASPELLKQLQATTSIDEALGLMADAMVKVEDPSKKAALASAAFSRAGLSMVNMLNTGSDGIDTLKARHLELAGSQEAGARNAEAMADAMTDVKASMSGVKAEILTALAPAFMEMTKRIQEWFTANREQIGEWVAAFGEKLPGRIQVVVDVFTTLFEALETVVGAVGGLKNAILIVVALMAAKFAVSLVMIISPIMTLVGVLGKLAFVLAGPLLVALKALGAALLANPIIIIAAAIAAAAFLIMTNWDTVKEFFVFLWMVIKDAFSAFLEWVKSAFLNFTPMGLIVKHWGAIEDFFEALWDGVTSIFQGAWEVIEDIVDNIVGAAERAIEAAKDVADFVGGAFSAIDISELTDAAAADVENGGLDGVDVDAALSASPETASLSSAKIEVSFENLPKGARVESGQSDDADIDLNLGYASGVA